MRDSCLGVRYPSYCTVGEFVAVLTQADGRRLEMEDSHMQQSASKAGPRRPHLLKRRKVLFAGVVVAVAIGFLVYMLVSQFTTYYLTVSEFVEKGDSLYGKQIRVAGQVVPESVDRDAENFTLSFTLADGEASLPVDYKGVVPDTFKAGSDLVLEGKCDAQGVFQATDLIAKCPSKYEPAE